MSWLSNLFKRDFEFTNDKETHVVRMNGLNCKKTPAQNIVVGSMLSNKKRVRGIKIYKSLEEVNIYYEGDVWPDVVSLGNHVYVVEE